MANGAGREVEPWAKRQQGESGGIDQLLLRRARKLHPTVRWWWGQKQTPEGWGAYCYACDKTLATWDRRWPVTHAAIEAARAHRAEHLEAERVKLLVQGQAAGRAAEARERNARRAYGRRV